MIHKNITKVKYHDEAHLSGWLFGYDDPLM
jgi:hypothetical protein